MQHLFTTKRPLSVQSSALDQVVGAGSLVPLKLEGAEGINQLFEYKLTLQTPDALNFVGGAAANYALQDLVGHELCCQIELEGHGSFVAGLAGLAGMSNQDAGVREISGLITQARFLGEDSRHALYELTLRPWLHLATLTSDCKVFQDQTPVDVINAVLADYPFAVERRLIESYPVRDYCVQYNESDFEFVTRIMQTWGINYHFEHSGGVHRLVLSDHNGAFKPAHDYPFYPLGHKLDREYIHAFSPAEQMVSARFASVEYDYTRPKTDLASEHKAPRNTGHNTQEVYQWHQTRYAQPNAGATKPANQTEEQGKHLARLRMQALRQDGLRASGVGHVRGIQAGSTFKLSEYPQSKANTEYITLGTHVLIENVSEDTQRDSSNAAQQILQNVISSVQALNIKALSDAQRLSGQWRVVTQFDVQPSTEALRPAFANEKPRTHGPETAVVCGPSADTAESNIYTDPLGRIKVQFHWDRYGQKNQNSSCWVRVGSAWAGNQLGAMHVPRVGQEVIVDFLGGDPDAPICTGRVYNQLNMPPWALPSSQALSGFRSRELTPSGGNSAAGRSNHLILDDTEAKIQAQLKSDHAHSQLSLGHISRIEDNQGRKDARGEGFELRTDNHGAIRAKDGLLISTEGRSQAQSHMLDMGETTSRLTQARDQHETLANLAKDHQAHDADDQDEVAKQLKAQNEAIKGEAKGQAKGEEGQHPELTEPYLIMASPAGIQSTTAQTTHHHSGQHHAITSGGHTSISTGKSLLASVKEHLRLFVQQGIRIFSAKGKVQLQAQDNDMELIAKRVVEIMSTGDWIKATAAKGIRLQSGPTEVTITPEGVKWVTPGYDHVYAADHQTFTPSSAAAVAMPKLPIPTDVKDFSTQLNLSENLAFSFAGTKADVYVEAGDSVSFLGASSLNDSQKTQTIHADEAQTVVAFVGDGGWEMNDHEQGDGCDGCCDCGTDHDSEEA
ncbi:type VI secretion system Vgr family protein [Limnohabitans sp. Rim8]|uniref:type VI secretion system Vgr family protein n=1 Tax=Limnohabitans sp. Rim8 TaxID=1100718 RepID=UPI0018EEC31B|nr:type VI secretion system Vgr family protein [Limnohabitans sp. Rim8]